MSDRYATNTLDRAIGMALKSSPGSLLAGLLVVSFAATACFRETDVRSAATPGAVTIRVEVVAERLVVPWGVAFAPDGRIFVTERPGRIRVIENGSLRSQPWANLEGSVGATGEAGLLGIAVAPDFEATGHVFVCVTQRRRTPGGVANDIMRFSDRAGIGTEPTIIVSDLPAAMVHAGCALAFGPDGMLYVTIGDARRPSEAARQGSLVAKLLRYTPDGGIPADNPYGDSPVYASGLRNSQGLAWSPETGALFATEHGPSGFPDERFRRNNDEVNAISRGADYGWPAVAGMSDNDRFVRPLVAWNPAIAPSGIAVYDGPFEPWRGSLFVGALRGQQLQRLELEPAPDERPAWRVGREEVYLDEELGRIRAVVMGPDGYLYITTSNRDGRGQARPEDDRLLRIVPVP
jgi:glucose/arabinose dehydrogenase